MAKAFEIYHSNFKPSKQLQSPYIMSCVNVIIADTLEEAQRLATSFYRMFLGIIRNERKLLQPPIDTMDDVWNVNEEAYVRQMTSCAFIGTKETVKREISLFIERYRLNEIMITSPIYDQEARLYSTRMFAEIMKELA